MTSYLKHKAFFHDYNCNHRRKKAGGIAPKHSSEKALQ